MNEFDRSILRQLFIDALPDCAIILLDVDGNILTWNAGAKAILGYAAAEVVGQHHSRLYPKSHLVSTNPTAVLDDARALDRHEERGRLVRKGGVEIDAYSVVMPLHDRQKTLLGFGLLACDATISPGRAAIKVADIISPPRGERILVVDDNKDVLDVALKQLKSLGYEVLQASSGAEALELLARVPDVDLLFTDVCMPGGMGGREVADKARQIRPGLKVLFASGYFEGALVRDGAVQEGVQFIVKPYRKTELAQKLKEVLSAAALS